MATRQSFCPQILGYCPGTAGNSTFALSSATSWMALGIIPKVTDKLYDIRAFVSAVANTLTAANITCEIQTDSGSTPGTPSGTDVTGYGAIGANAVPSAGAFDLWDFTVGGTNTANLTTLTAGTLYWAVFKNTNATPTSNNCTFKNFSSGGVLPGNLWSLASASALLAPRAATTTNGASWSANASVFPNYRLHWSDGSYEGIPITAQGNISTVANGTNEVGAKFTLPGTASVQYKIAGIQIPIQRSGAATGDPQFKLYNGASLMATTSIMVGGSFNTSAATNFLASYFSSTQTLNGGSTYRATLSDSAADGGSIGYQLATANTLDSDANSSSLVPFEATWQQTVWNGSAWTDTAGILPFVGLLLDSTGEFSASGGTSGGSMGVIRGNTWRYVG